VELAGELDGLYEGALVVPSDAGPLTVQLSADLRNAGIALDPLSLEITGTATVTACGAVSLPRIRRTVRVRNTGEGNLHVCDVQLVGNPRNSHGRPVLRCWANRISPRAPRGSLKGAQTQFRHAAAS